MSASRLDITVCPIPADAITTTDSVVTARMAQRGFPRGTGGRAGRRDGCGRRCGAGWGRGDRGGVGKGTPPDDGRTWDPEAP
ncbi:hypothetical protein GCM10027074_45460 [Streptomyces deserti]